MLKANPTGQPGFPLRFESDDYLKLIERGGPIGIIGPALDFCVDFPALEVIVENNGVKTVFFDEAQVLVERSQPDFTPLPVLLSDYDQTGFFKIANEGFAAIDSCTVRYSISPQKWTALPSTFDHIQTLGRFSE